MYRKKPSKPSSGKTAVFQVNFGLVGGSNRLLHQRLTERNKPAIIYFTQISAYVHFSTNATTVTLRKPCKRPLKKTSINQITMKRSCSCCCCCNRSLHTSCKNHTQPTQNQDPPQKQKSSTQSKCTPFLIY